MLDETSTHRLYLANPVEIDNTSRTGSLLLENNIDQTVQILADNYKAYFSVILIDDRSDEYIVLSSGSGTQRAGEVFSLSKNQSVGNKFCTSSGLVIYQDYLIYGNCDIQLNRPWGAGEASSVVIQNLSTGDEQVIAQSDVLHQYSPVKVANNILYYSESSVTNEEDWNDRSLLKSQQLEHDLNLLTI